MRYLQPCLDFHLILVWFHLPSSKLIDKNMKRGLYGFIFCSYPLCSILLSSSVLGIRPWSASDFSHLPEGVRNCRKYILSLWVLLLPRVCGDPHSSQMDGRVISTHKGSWSSRHSCKKASGQGVRTHPPMVLLAMVRERN